MKFLVFSKFILLLNAVTVFSYADTGVLPRKIVLATNQPLSGPAKEYSFIGRSSKAYFKYINDQGGIHGRTIHLKIVDDQFRSEKSIKKISELIVETEIFAIFSGLGNKTFQSIYPFLKKQKIPSFFVGSNLPEWTKPVHSNIFTFLPSPEIEARVLGRYLTKNHSGKEIIIWYIDRPEYFRSVKAMTNELFGLSAKLLPGKKGRLKAEWNLIEKRKPDLIVALGNFYDLTQFLKDYPKIDIPVYTGHSLADSRITKWIDVFSLLRVLTAYPLIFEKENKGVLLHKKILSLYEPSLTPNRWTLYGHAVAELMVEVLSRSGRSLNRQKAIIAAESLIDWKGRLMSPVSIDSKNHLAITALRVSQILPGKVNHLSEWIDGRK